MSRGFLTLGARPTHQRACSAARVALRCFEAVALIRRVGCSRSRPGHLGAHEQRLGEYIPPHHVVSAPDRQRPRMDSLKHINFRHFAGVRIYLSLPCLVFFPLPSFSTYTPTLPLFSSPSCACACFLRARCYSYAPPRYIPPLGRWRSSVSLALARRSRSPSIFTFPHSFRRFPLFEGPPCAFFIFPVHSRRFSVLPKYSSSSIAYNLIPHPTLVILPRRPSVLLPLPSPSTCQRRPSLPAPFLLALLCSLVSHVCVSLPARSHFPCPL
ncbi:hypothetical protein DFH06DRAFT_1231814 [Mycena polygramma]|nr:hypothetical protein DFH06DRAFT_1231814 [Mycena polygramma]